LSGTVYVNIKFAENVEEAFGDSVSRMSKIEILKVSLVDEAAVHLCLYLVGNGITLQAVCHVSSLCTGKPFDDIGTD